MTKYGTFQNEKDGLPKMDPVKPDPAYPGAGKVGAAKIDPIVTESAPDTKTSQILGDIAQTRAEMSGTIGELQQKLTPAAIKEQVAEKIEDAKQAVKSEIVSVKDAAVEKVGDAVSSAQDTVMEGGRSVVEFVKANPIPLALTGAGLVWLFVNRRNRSRARYGADPIASLDVYDREDASYAATRGAGNGKFARARDRGESTTRKMGRKMSEVTHTVQDKASQLADDAGQLASRAEDSVVSATRNVAEQSGRLARNLRERSVRAGERVQRTFQANPLLIGAAVSVAGAAVGMAIPVSQREKELVGEAGAELAREAQGMARGALGKVQEAAKQLGRDGE